MLKTIQICNFQSHKKTLINLHPGVNIFVGSTGKGKTAILRALRKLKDNRPSGDSFCSWWGGVTRIAVVNENDVEISYTRDKKDEYHLSTFDKPFEANGRGVPVEVQKELNLSEINIQRQHDQPFLLSSTAGDVASYFNKIAGLTKIDTATSNINSWISSLNSDIKKCEKDIAKNEIDLAKYDHLEKLEIELEVLEQMEKRRRSKFSRYSDLNVLIKNIEETQSEIDALSLVLEAEPLMTKLTMLQSTKKTKQSEYLKLDILIRSIVGCQGNINVLKKQTMLENEVSTLLGFYVERNRLKEALNSLNKLLSNINNTNTQLTTIRLQIKENEATLKREMGEHQICPLCGQTIKDEKHDH